MSMDKAKISIVVPAYNVRDYIEDCIESILDQTYQNLEIILVDDGSTDGTTDICIRLQKRDPRIKLIIQENQGIARTRKIAAQKASGYYLAFVDADDYVNKDLYEKLIKNADGYDLVTSGYYRIIKGQRYETRDMLAKGAYVTESDLEHLISNMICYHNDCYRGITSYIWNKLYRTELANEVFEKINENLFIAEDSEFLYRYVLQSKSIFITDVCGYMYRYREGSALHSVQENYLTNTNELYLTMKEVFEKHPLKVSLMNQLQVWITLMAQGCGDPMGFCEAARRRISYIFPFYNLLDERRVVLYGAGAVGRSYYLQLKDSKEFDLIAWVDKNYEKSRVNGLFVKEPAVLIESEYDYIIIAVKKDVLAHEIKTELIEAGVQEEKILWKEPLPIYL